MPNDASQRRCPRDGGVLRREQAFGEVELDRCRECDALWFDGGELARWSEARGRQPVVPDVLAAPEGPAAGDGGASESGLVPVPSAARSMAPAATCPACKEQTLIEFEWQGGRLGTCPRCKGLFVPPELQQRLDRPAPPGPPPMRQPHDVPSLGTIVGVSAEVLAVLSGNWSLWRLLRRMRRSLRDDG